MSTPGDYLAINKKAWNTRTRINIESAFYDMAGFLKGASSLNEIELQLLGNVAGQSILHLQCHFGQDTLSLARLGAEVTGADLSDVAIDEARQLNTRLGLSADFICCDIYALPDHLDRSFDIVFTSYGAIGWLPDLTRWAQIVRRFLKPGGKLILVEFHPMVWMFDDLFLELRYSYFNSGPIMETNSGTYADQAAPVEFQDVGWNHPISEVFASLMQSGLTLTHFQEYNYSPYACFRTVEKIDERKYRIPHLSDKIPMVYSLTATAPAARM
jgi:SAM-dependent methyltransferase